MAVALENLIDLNLLSHYDSKLKAWVEAQITAGGQIAVTSRADLPTKGEENKIYFVEDAILQYTAADGYKEIGGTEPFCWKDF